MVARTDWEGCWGNGGLEVGVVTELNGEMKMENASLWETNGNIYGRESNALKGGGLDIDET